MKKLLVTFFSLCILFIINAQPVATTFKKDPLKIKQYTLKNGLTVMLSENHDLPEVYGMVVVKAGGKNDPKDATGLAHYLEHMLFKGTTTMGTIDYEKEKPFLGKINNLYEDLGKTTDVETRQAIQKQINEQSILAGEFAIPNEMDRMLRQIGSTGLNAFTTEDYTAYHNTFPSSQIERWLEIYSHRFENPVFRLFQSELETVYEEKNRGEDDGFSRLFELYMKNFYKNHPYGQQSIIGTTEHLKNPPLKKMYDYFNTYYVANNMALILSGDFDSEAILPMIEEKFGDWRTGKLPGFPKVEEEPFSKREFLKVKYTPIKVGIIGYRSPENGHDDEPAFDVCNFLLYNENQTGLINKLALEDKIMEAGVQNIPYNDHAASIIFFIPKIVGQSLEKAEGLVKEQLEKLKQGEFSEEMLIAAKQAIHIEIERMFEQNPDRVRLMSNCFTQNRNWDDFISYLPKLNSITKDDVIRIADKYYGENYLCLYSKMGFPKKEKLDKPGFKPVIPKNELKSEFRKKAEQILPSKVTSRYVQFDKDIDTLTLAENVKLNAVSNPFNTLFTLEIIYGIGSVDLPTIQYANAYFNLIGTNTYSASEFKEKLFLQNATCWFEADDHQFKVVIEGLDAKLDTTLRLVQNFLADMRADESKIKKVVNDIKTMNKFSRRQPNYVSQALQEFVLYGKNSKFHREFSTTQLKSLKGIDIIRDFRKAQGYEITFNYVGKVPPFIVGNELAKNFKWLDSLQPKKEQIIFDANPITENTIVFVPKKKATQSQLWFNISGKKLDLQEVPTINAFNNYFGHDMSGVVFQEIREFRSLAYSARASYKLPRIKGKNSIFFGYVGCQGDKTSDALNAMKNLINDMPLKTEREETIKSSLIEEAQSSRPGFRELIDRVENWKAMGYTDDPNKEKMEAYKALKFTNITSFYEKEIKNKPMLITVVGDKSRVNIEELKKYGKLTVLSENDLFVN